MTRYKQTDFADEETSSIGSIHLNVRTSPNMHIRFANRVSKSYEIRGHVLKAFNLRLLNEISLYESVMMISTVCTLN